MKTLYIRDRKDLSKGQRVITVVSELDKETNRIKIAWSVCSKNDQFNKWKGRLIASRRFDQINKLVENVEPGEIDYGKFSGEFLYVGPKKFENISDSIRKFVLEEIQLDKENHTGK